MRGDGSEQGVDATRAGSAGHGALPWGGHFCQLHERDEDLLDALVSWFASGLQAHEKCLWVTAEPLPAPAARRALRAVVWDFDSRERTGQIQLIDYADWYADWNRGGPLGEQDVTRVIDGWLASEHEALTAGYAGLRVSWDVAWMRGEPDALARCLVQAQRALRGHKVIVLHACSLLRLRDAAHVEVRRSAAEPPGPAGVAGGFFVEPAPVLPPHDRSDARQAGHERNVTLDPAARIAELEQLLLTEQEGRAEAERAARSGELCAGILGHDLRTPLSAIVAGAQLLTKLAGKEGEPRPARRILSSAERMARMIDQLLDVTRIRMGGGLGLQLGEQDLAMLTRDVVAELEEVSPGRAIAVEVRGDSTGIWDGDRLLQVISNLVGNAIEHGEPGTPIEVEIDGTDTNAVRLRVRNEGAIPAALLPHLFQPFGTSQLRRGRRRGLGLGLYIADRIVAVHGGTIQVFSTEPLGTWFEAVLPRRGVVAPPGGGAGGRTGAAGS